MRREREALRMNLDRIIYDFTILYNKEIKPLPIEFKTMSHFAPVKPSYFVHDTF